MDSPIKLIKYHQLARPENQTSLNKTLRINFSDELTKEQQQPFLTALESFGTWIERANSHFVCVNIPPTANYESVCKYLSEHENIQALAYETCEERVPGSFDDRPDNEAEVGIT
jgi:Domain of unknown function (DUF4265)